MNNQVTLAHSKKAVKRGFDDTINDCYYKVIEDLPTRKVFMFYTYIMTNKRKNVLYVGVTRDLQWRAFEHKQKLVKGFTSRYNVNKLVYYEEYQYVEDAIRREKQIKRWRREKKEYLIRQINPYWQDLSFDWF